MAENIEERWINVNEAAEYFGVKPAAIRDWIRKGEGNSCSEDWEVLEIQVLRN